MDQVRQVMQQMINITEEELESFLNKTSIKTFKRQEIVSTPDSIPNNIFFINKGIIRVFITDSEGTEHTIHFALENQFIADYSNFIKQQPSFYTLQALEETEVVILPRKTIEWGYNNLTEGQKMGRLVAEYYFIYQDDRIKNTYTRTPKQRYDSITDIFPNIHNRVPQHMIASYLGITPIHLSRLKKEDSRKL
ncbi:CRP-like cAMP-binding protein [Chryseobacterium sp. SLBN-27]|jgi:CRP-like cAMP-binding protein|uniref:Crp/Fnr family transcriptional regulator n=1 Tax=Chryseobacterium TaxID=59732 RepID=UPI00285F8864|nr:Crp/Fnr family transcriptional regulator [Chryseobacterium sp. SLBN-27]MDR6159951.1 CRP-like cAMP-binding protein [Chryseobacterium sp. SLBN-27]